MKKNLLKFTVGFLALSIGIAVVWTSGIYRVLLPAASTSSLIETVPMQQTGDKSGKVLLRFRNFDYGKEWVANFEITNETTQPIHYVGSKRKDRLDYCTIAVKHEEPFPTNPDGKIDNLTFKIRDVCYYGTFLTLQTLHPGETIVLATEDHTVRDMLAVKDSKQETKAQIGFEVFTGEEKRREILWSEEITFPYDEYR